MKRRRLASFAKSRHSTGMTAGIYRQSPFPSINNLPSHSQACIISLSVSPTPFHPSWTFKQLPICTSNFVSPFHGPFFQLSPFLVPPGHLLSATRFMEHPLLNIHDHEVTLYICAHAWLQITHAYM